MKYLLILLAFISTAVVAAEQPAFLKDATIVVTLKSGKQYAFSANEWKVVPRLDKETVCTIKPELVIREEQTPNRARFFGGVGQDGFNSKVEPNRHKVSTSYGPVFGMGYDRMISKRFSLGGQAISNGTYTLGLGFDF